MFGFLASLRDRLDPLVRLGRAGKRQRFLEQLVRGELTILSAPDGLDLAPGDLTPENLLEITEKAARELDADRSFQPFTLEQGEKRCVPIFSTQRAAETFIRGHVLKVNRIIPFQLLTAPGVEVLPPILEYGAVILNPGTAASYELHPDEIAELRSAFAAFFAANTDASAETPN